MGNIGKDSGGDATPAAVKEELLKTTETLENTEVAEEAAEGKDPLQPDAWGQVIKPYK